MTDQPSPGSFRIRPMRLDDLGQVQALDQISFSLPWPPSAYRFELKENSHSRLWVAEYEYPDGSNVIVGVIVLWMIIDEAHIATIAVHPDYRRRGIGKQLVATALAEGIRQGAASATLEVRAGNEAAQNLYRQFRFEVVGLRPRYYRDNNEDALIMTVHSLDDRYLQWLETYAGVGHSEPPGQSGK